jgi:L-ascorbate metabolism protein UlaG (beta-lactamase superfamily)
MIKVLLIITVLLVVIYAVLNFYPPFGGSYSRQKRAEYSKSPQFKNGKFHNQIHTAWDTSLGSMLSMMKDFIKGNPERKPKSPIPMADFIISGTSGNAKVTWFGHSAFLLEMEGKSILFDPMFGKAPTPFPFRNQRYSGKLPFAIEDLPTIDAVFLTHYHYDHLDYGTIMKLKGKVEQFFVPLGVGSHLERWGISPEIISEHDWWNEFEFEGIQFACTPARHFSGRGLTNRNSTLWCSWVIIGKESKIFFSGDGGYGPHFKEIGSKYGPFDLTLMECGQYDARWAAIHMLPEETVQAHLDVKGKVLIPVHWGAFTLSLHAWHDPVERAVKAAEEAGVDIATPRIGESVTTGTGNYPAAPWWKMAQE